MGYASVMHNVREPVDLKKRYGENSWVVISGATDELGHEFAKVFSKKGFNLVLVDSDQEQLEAAKQMIADTGV